MRRLYLAATLTVLAATSGAATGFDPDPKARYEVMRGTSAQPVALQKEMFEDMIAGADTCAPMMYLDQIEAGFIHVTLLAACHDRTDVTLVHYGKSKTVSLSENGAAFAKLESAVGTGRVTAAFSDGTVIAKEMNGPNRASAELIKN